MVNSKQKGAAGEREFAKFLKELGYDARRGQQYSGSSDSPDIVCDDGVCHWEVKRTEKLRLYDALNQAINDSDSMKTPVVAHRASRKEWVCILRAKDFVDMLKFVKIADEL